MHDCLNDQPASIVSKALVHVVHFQIYACLAAARARAPRLIQPARRAPLNAGMSFPTRDRRLSETEIHIVQKSQNMHAQKWANGPVEPKSRQQEFDPTLRNSTRVLIAAQKRACRARVS